jgi:hypothetical protein
MWLSNRKWNVLIGTLLVSIMLTVYLQPNVQWVSQEHVVVRKTTELLQFLRNMKHVVFENTTASVSRAVTRISSVAPTAKMGSVVLLISNMSTKTTISTTVASTKSTTTQFTTPATATADRKTTAPSASTGATITPTATTTTTQTVSTTRAAASTIKPTADPETLGHFMSREMTPETKDILMDIFRVFMDVAKKHNWTWFIYGGSLMGSVRHHGIIPWDDDIDIMLNKSATKELKQVFKTLEPNYTVYDRGNDPILKLFSQRSTTCVLKSCRYKYPYIDVCFFAEDKDRIWDNHPYFSRNKFKKSHIFPLHVRPFEGLMVYAPKVSLHLLNIVYGVTDICQTWRYFHNHESGGHKVVKVKCELLKNHYPFVFRRWVDGKMEETLKIGRILLRFNLVSGELEWTVTKPFSTVPIGGVVL